MGLFDIFKSNKNNSTEVLPSKEFFYVFGREVTAEKNVLTELDKRFIAFDVETTGLDPYCDQIIEIGAVIYENGIQSQTFHSLIKNRFEISEKAQKVNNITEEELKTAPNEKQVIDRFVKFIGDALEEKTIMCAHNAKFDIEFISKTLERCGYNGNIRYFDTLKLSYKLLKNISNHKQETIAKHLGIEYNVKHRALEDAIVCGQILLQLKERQLMQLI